MNTHHNSESTLFTAELMESTYLWCYRKLGNTHDAEDLSQEILLEAIVSYRKKCLAGNPPAAFYPWYWGLANNRLMLFYRSQKNRAVLLGESVELLSGMANEPFYIDLQDIDEGLIAEKERADLSYQLSLLSRNQRECVIMYYLQNRSVKEIARHLGIPEGTVKSRLFDARKHVKKGMENPMENHESKIKRLSYAPAELDMCGSDQIPDYWSFLRDRIVEQILAACAYEGKTAREIAEAIGVAPVYFEDKLAYLLEHKFLKETAPGTYIDDFCVFPQQAWLDRYVDTNCVKQTRMPRVAEIVKSLIPEARKHICNEADFTDGYLLWFLYVRAVHAMDGVMLKHYRESCPCDVPDGNGKDWRLVVKVRYPDEEVRMKSGAKGVSWSNMHMTFKTSRGHITVANLYEKEPFGDRDHIISEVNADLFMRLYDDPHLTLNDHEKEQAAYLVSKGFLVSRDGGLYLNVPVLNRPEVEKLEAIFADALGDIAREMVADLVKATDANLLSHVRAELMEEYVNYVMLLSFDCICELFWYAFHEGHDLEIPADYDASAAGIAIYMR